MKKATSRRRKDPTVASLRELPLIDFDRYRLVRNPFARRIAREGIEIIHDQPSAASLAEMPEVDPYGARARRNPYASRAAEAVALFCYQAKKWLGAFVTVLGGLDTLVFAGGIGENAPEVRARICAGLGFLGLELDEARNGASEPVISKDRSKVTVRIIRTDEEMQIAKSVWNVMTKQRRNQI